MTAVDTILVVNAGSSSVKFQVFAVDAGGNLKREIKGQMDGIGRMPKLKAVSGGGPAPGRADLSAGRRPRRALGASPPLGRGCARNARVNPIAVGHRVVHGGPDYDRPVRVDAAVVARLERYIPLAPLHQPHNLAPIRSILSRSPGLPQVACFDTAFHRSHGAFADYYALPHDFHAEGIRRYGFHGLSYEYVAEPSA